MPTGGHRICAIPRTYEIHGRRIIDSKILVALLVENHVPDVSTCAGCQSVPVIDQQITHRVSFDERSFQPYRHCPIVGEINGNHSHVDTGKRVVSQLQARSEFTGNGKVRPRDVLQGCIPLGLG